MKKEHHIRKISSFVKTINKLDDEDYETLIEDYLLIAAHIINASMHKLLTLKEEKDIKHNQLHGYISRNNSLKDDSEEVAGLILELEQLRPSHVYGKGENGETVEHAKSVLNKIVGICKKFLGDEINEI